MFTPFGWILGISSPILDALFSFPEETNKLPWHPFVSSAFVDVNYSWMIFVTLPGATIQTCSFHAAFLGCFFSIPVLVQKNCHEEKIPLKDSLRHCTAMRFQSYGFNFAQKTLLTKSMKHSKVQPPGCQIIRHVPQIVRFWPQFE